MKNLNEFGVLEMDNTELQTENGGALSVNEERVICFCMFGLFGLAIYEIGRNQAK